MKNAIRMRITLICSFVIFAIGVFRILTEDLSSTPLIVAYLFIVTGLVGAVANGLLLIKSKP